MLVKYVGRRALLVDPLYRTGAIWEGPGDVQNVPDDMGAKMCANHPDMFQEVLAPSERTPHEYSVAVSPSPLDGETVTEYDGRVVPLPAASRKALAKHAAEDLGLRVEDHHSKEDILGFVADYHEYKIRPDAGGVAPEPEEPPAPETTKSGKPRAKPRKPRKAPEPEPEPEGLKPVEVERMEAEAKQALDDVQF